MKRLIGWLTTSSSDPLKTAASVKGALKIGFAYLTQTLTSLCTLGVFCVAGDITWANEAIEVAGAFTAGVLYIWGAVESAYGLYRKASLGRWAHPDA